MAADEYDRQTDASLSIVLTVYNKEFQIARVVEGIVANTTSPFQLVIVYDACIDRSEEKVNEVLGRGTGQMCDLKVIHTPDINENRANNVGMRAADGDYFIILQDDMLIQEKGWDQRMLGPMKRWGDVFAVGARDAVSFLCSMPPEKTVSYSCLMGGIRDVFQVRDAVNRGPIAFCGETMRKLDYFDEAFAPCYYDDMDLCMRAWIQLGKVCGVYNVGWKNLKFTNGSNVDAVLSTGGVYKDWIKKHRLLFWERYHDYLTGREQNHDEDRPLVVSMSEDGQVRIEGKDVVSGAGDVEMLNKVAAGWIHAGKPQEAMGVLSQALGIDPDNRTTVMNVIAVYKIAGMVKEACEFVDAYMQRWPGDAELKQRRAELVTVSSGGSAGLSSSVGGQYSAGGDVGDGGHYGREYFDWQKKIGAFGGIANLFKFREFVGSCDTVVDFGCGGGYLLKNLACERKIGVEINNCARTEAIANGIDVVAEVGYLSDETADIVISNHALEHVESPLEAIKSLRRKIKPGGKIVFVVPHQDCSELYNPRDVNKHLYTWNQQTLGNLFAAAGYRVLKVEAFQHQWPTDHVEIMSRFGEEEFHRRCREYAVGNNNYQVRVLGVKD